MSLLIYPVFSSPVPEIPDSVRGRSTGEYLAREFEALDRIACDFGLEPFTAFADRREVPLDWEGPPWEFEQLLGPCGDWYFPAAGRAAFDELAGLIRGDPDAARYLEDPDEVATELEDLARVLAFVEKTGTRFRLDIS